MVLIESDWNLKNRVLQLLKLQHTVLIESDWNLKDKERRGIALGVLCINRIRLEFKGY